MCVDTCVMDQTEPAVVELQQQQQSSRQRKLPAELLHSLFSVEKLPNSLHPAALNVCVCALKHACVCVCLCTCGALWRDCKVPSILSGIQSSPLWQLYSWRLPGQHRQTEKHTRTNASVNMILNGFWILFDLQSAVTHVLSTISCFL